MSRTTGDWQIVKINNEYNPFKGYLIVTRDENRNLATIHVRDGAEVEAETNAKLMAAAPDLLKELEQAKKTFLTIQHGMRVGQSYVASDMTQTKIIKAIDDKVKNIELVIARAKGKIRV